MRHVDDVALDEYVAAIATTRVVMGPGVRIQAPPNLVDLTECKALLDAGVDDFGGVSPLTPDHVNPELPWQEPDGGWDEAGRVDLNTQIDQTGRVQQTRGDFDEVYGDWASLRAQVRNAPHFVGQAIGSTDVAVALRKAEADPAGLSEAHALALMTAPEGKALDAVAAFADELRRETVGDDVTYVVNRNLNFSNIMLHGVPGTAYFDLARAVKEAAPSIHLHAFSPMEIMNGVARTGMTVHEFLTHVRAAGVDSTPGTAAEILDDEVRWILTKDKLPTSEWINVIETAHRVGLPTPATMMYGHVDHPKHWVAHLRTIAAVQRRTGGFTEFVPLPFVHQSSPIYLAGVARPGPTVRDNRAVHAVSRIMLHGLIDNIQCSWVKLGPEVCTQVLNGGVNDLGGTLMLETISRMAGSTNGSQKSVEDLHRMAALAGRPAAQRTTTYQPVTVRAA